MNIGFDHTIYKEQDKHGMSWTHTLIGTNLYLPTKLLMKFDDRFTNEIVNVKKLKLYVSTHEKIDERLDDTLYYLIEYLDYENNIKYQHYAYIPVNKLNKFFRKQKLKKIL